MASKILKEFIKKGFVLDDERLKQGETVVGKDYFRELLDRIRSIRASERRIWQQVTDILPNIASYKIESIRVFETALYHFNIMKNICVHHVRL